MKGFLRSNFKRLILPTILIVLILSLSTIVFVVALKRVNQKKSLIADKEHNLEVIASLVNNYKQISGYNEDIIKRVSKNGEGFELLPFLEEISNRVGINDKIASMNPSGDGPEETSASFVLKDISMDELITLLTEIRNSGKTLLIKKMQLRVTESKQRSLDASFVISTLKFSKNDLS